MIQKNLACSPAYVQLPFFASANIQMDKGIPTAKIKAMSKNWNTYRLIIFVVIIIGFFISRTFFAKEEPVDIQPFPNTFNRDTNNIILTTHAKCRMECRDITMQEVKVLNTGEINHMKSNLQDERGPTYALEGYSQDKQHLRIIFAPKENEMVVVSCIDLDREYKCDCN